MRPLLLALLLLASPYRIVLRDGTVIEAKAPPTGSGTVLLYHTLKGTLTSLPAEQVDEYATARANAPKPAPPVQVEVTPPPRPTANWSGSPFGSESGVAPSFREAAPTPAPTAEPYVSSAPPPAETKPSSASSWAWVVIFGALGGLVVVLVALFRSARAQVEGSRTPTPLNAEDDPLPSAAPPAPLLPSRRSPSVVGQIAIFFGVVVFIIGAAMGLNLIVCLTGVGFIVGGFLTRPDEAAKLCPACRMKVPLEATICGHCRSTLVAGAVPAIPVPAPPPSAAAETASAAELVRAAATELRSSPRRPSRWPTGKRTEGEDPSLIDLPDGRRFAYFGDSQYVLDVVGEARYQSELESVVSSIGRRFRAALRREPSNPHDENAIQVWALEPGVLETPVGYVPRGLAVLWAPYLDRALAATGREVLGRAESRGGTPDKPKIGVALFLEADDVFAWIDETADPEGKSR